jgi:hypothetical protein
MSSHPAVSPPVMAGLVPAIHVFLAQRFPRRGSRDKPGVTTEDGTTTELGE